MNNARRFSKYNDILNENITKDILNQIYSGKETRSYTLINNDDFELKFNNMDSYLILLWINVKPRGRYKGVDIFKALVEYCQAEKLSEGINASGSKGIFKGVYTTGYYNLMKWGFESVKGIDWVNKILGTGYKSWIEARQDKDFLPNWKQHGKESDFEFDLSKNSLSLKTLDKL